MIMQERQVIFTFIWISLFFVASDSVAKSSCPVQTVKREILNRGFHRDLVTRLDLGGFAEQVKRCRVLFRQNIPSALFLDPYQLSSLRQHNQSEVILLAAVDLEAPEYLATGQTALIYAKPDPACIHCFISIVPIHARYHRPSAVSHDESFTLQNPQILIFCSKDSPHSGCSDYPVVEAPCGVDSGNTCGWLDVPYIPVPKKLLLEVPVGMTQHQPVVCTVTIAVTLVCTWMILIAVYKHSHLLVKPSV
ncbi:phosphatidylinositol-glycan biosynthesis class X protein isoform X2 [Spea bombifrons]|uniref:phosphatidylinositol-glycan biosynthesis class X protein isoform X2 n=1 Tax=Spea bombifrons TaxID=233779 RepID=UPI00234BD757|nr:phosphatidylinositol-glycan biosynthesis class X protein isoform X2 [Spea bombifrons]